MADLRGLEHDVGQALALQLEHAQLEELVDQAADAAVELRLVGVEGHQDADAELAVHHHGRAEPDHQQVLHAEQQAVELLVEQLQLLRTQAGVDLFHQQAEPYRAALVLALEQLQRADAAHRPRKWLCWRAAWTICSSVALRNGRYQIQRPRA